MEVRCRLIRLDKNQNRFAIMMLAFVFISGCGETVVEHGHEQGTHGGIVFAVGDAHYHGEALFSDGKFELYLLDHDQFKVLEVESQTLEAYLRPFGDAKAFTVAMEPVTQNGDSKGMTSRFVGKLPDQLPAKQLYVVIPSIRIRDNRYRFSFSTPDPIMPSKIADQAEVDLYMTPGGLYSQADIEANGSQTASKKFVGFKASHDMNPKVGVKICPVTQTVANPKCNWIINGQEYWFCCPPCVDEFVALAKKDPKAIEPADAYVKK